MQSSTLLVVLALTSLAPASAINLRSAPDVSAEVARETQQNIQIHDGFQAQEQKDAETVNQVHADKDLSQLQVANGNWVVALDKDMKTKMLVQVQTPALLSGIKDPCEGITCGA